MKNGIERRAFALREVRAMNGEDDQAPVIEGYAAVFDQMSEDLGGFREIVRPGAFRDASKSDVRALMNHDANYVLGRTVSGTLELTEDEHGLQIRTTPPETQWAKDLMVTMQRGDVDQMSFGFMTIRDNWFDQDGQVIRELLEVELFDVSVVTFPAYPQTVVNARDLLAAFEDQRSADSAASQEDPAELEEGESKEEVQAHLDVLRQRLDIVEKS